MFQRDAKDYFAASKAVIELSPSDFDPNSPSKLQRHKCSIVLFYAPWCPHCKAMKDKWEQLGKMAMFFDVCAFNCEKNRAFLSQIQEEVPELVRGFPTMILYKNGEPIEKVGQNENEREVKHLLQACMRGCNIQK